jgi:Kef-type K+ transport system membrane component KefB
MGRLFARIGQPAVMGEMFAGIVLGPSLLGRVSPDVMQYLFPSAIGASLRVVAQLGVVLYLFMIGLELDLRRLHNHARRALSISMAGILAPLAFGIAVSPLIHDALAPAGVSQFVFAAFFAVALAVTAFPVLARIVSERRIERSALGVMALTCAAADDLAAWCLLSLVVSFARAEAEGGVRTIGLALLYVALMFGLVRPWLIRLARRQAHASELTHGTLAVLFVGLLCSALATEWIGIHALFGAFLFGAFVPAESQLANRVVAKLDDLVRVLLLPLFFAITGLRMQIGTIEGAKGWLLCALIVLLAFLGKLGGTSIAARLTGMRWHQAVQLGALMNTRGLMELIVLNVGLDLGIISASLFAMMVIMALVTTCVAAPLLYWMGRFAPAHADDAPAEQARAVAQLR